nr:BON domain-containing protein [Aphanocapsa sp. GSE-SYN-MK-11-07L]
LVHPRAPGFNPPFPVDFLPCQGLLLRGCRSSDSRCRSSVFQQVTENTTTQSSTSNPSPKPGNTNAAELTNPTKAPSASVPKPQPLVASPAAGNPASASLSRTDSQIKAEILKQFKTSLPNHQLVVEVDNGNVTVSGMAATPEQLQRIQPVLGTIKGVGMVDITATAPAKM